VDALILAAGLGTRLGELTRSTPKPLVRVGGTPMLEHVALKLVAAGADRLIINTHHLSEQIVEFVRARGGFGVEVHFSHEETAPLETGGAIAKASKLLRRDAPFFLHNSDILTDLPLAEMYRAHQESEPIGTLAVMERATSRYLLFDEVGLLGRVDERKGLRIEVRAPAGAVRAMAFAGVHVISPGFPDMLVERGAFSILDPYLRLAREGKVIKPFTVDGYNWIDIGKPDQLEEANRRMAI
jgi:MurNAc alpha-1-phosphate uridylyltransferase